MATPARTPAPGENPVVVVIFTEGNQIRVMPDEFWVSKNAQQEVLWICKRDHVHVEGGCFNVHFDSGFPFTRADYEKDMEFSGQPREDAVLNKLYKYTVKIDGFPTLDPQGGVRP